MMPTAEKDWRISCILLSLMTILCFSVQEQEDRIKDPIWLKINSSILLNEGVRFCSDVSNKSGVSILDASDAIREIDFDVLFTYMDWRDSDVQARRQAAIKSEILVPSLISIEHILAFKNG